MNRAPRRILLRGERGQVMVIFALVSVVLFAIIGLSIDAGISYLTSDQVERAASAAALAGVAYLPGEYGMAQNAALVEAARNGITDNTLNGGTYATCDGVDFPCVETAEPHTNQLTVTIKVSVPTTFLKLLGFPAHTVVRSATAEYLPPIALGQPGSQQGSTLGSTSTGLSCDGIHTPYCTTPSSGLGSIGSNSFYFERTIGYGNPRSEGDPYTPTPIDSTTICSPQPSCSVVSTTPPLPDVHEISPMDGTEPYDATLNYNGGSNFLIAVPPGQTLDVQVYNPAFAPDSNDQPTTGNDIYSLHEDDQKFPDGSTTDNQYSAMAYTVWSVPTLSSPGLGAQVVSQEIFYPYNATCIYWNGKSCSNDVSYYWFPPTGTRTGQQTTVANQVPWDYHNWVSVMGGLPSGDGNANDANLFDPVLQAGALSNPSTTVDKYYRLEVDTLAWNGSPTCTTASCLTSAPDGKTAGNGYSTAHKGYAVRVVAPGTSTACGACTISAMDDMTVYTPINGSTAQTFSIPLFDLDTSYAGHTIEVDIFDIGDVSGGAAYVGIQQPNGQPLTGSSLKDLGTSVAENLNGNVGATTCPTCFQTELAGGTGTSIYNGQWVQVQIQVPPGYVNTGGYWTLNYQVAANATAGDTFAVQVGSAGSPDHLIA